MFSEFPNLHPLVVHFPIVLILLGAALQGLLVFKDWQQVRWGCLIILGGGFLGALLASTIFHAMPTGLSPQAMEVFNDHEKYSGYTLWLSGITFLLRGIGDFFKINQRPYEILVFVFALAAALFLSLAGHRGAQLVYVEGVGPKGNLLMKGDHHGKSPSAMEDMPMKDHAATGHPPEMTMDSADDHSDMAGMENEKTPSMEGMNHGQQTENKTSIPDKNIMPDMGQGTTGQGGPKKENMAGMDHSNMPGMGTQTKKKRTGNQMQNMPGMDHNNMPGMNQNINKTPANNPPMQNRPGMNHQQMNQQPPTKPAMDHSTMPGMNQSTKAPAGNQGMQNMPGMGSMPNTGNKTDMNGRPLIDATQPYDNNPGWKEIKRRSNQ